MLSPQTKFAKNVRATVRMANSLYRDYEFEPEIDDAAIERNIDKIYQVITNCGTDSWVTAGSGAKAVYRSLDYLRNVDVSDMSKPSLWALRKQNIIFGFSDKTISMAVALFDSTADIFTLDVHMLRGLLRTVGVIDHTGGVHINHKEYEMIENGICALLATNYPTVEPFVIQWALWNLWGFDAHQSHTPIFGI
jgi:hypothetical protein